MSKEKEGLEDYERCVLCRISYRKWKRHVYSQRHRQVLQDILTKFSKKVLAAKKSVKTPVIHDVHFEPDVKHWCYFCVKEIQKHEVKDEGVCVEYSTFIKHLADEDHKLQVVQFWRTHRLDKDKQKYYVIDPGKLEKFEERVKEAMDKYLTQRYMERKTEAARIERLSDQRRRLVDHHRILRPQLSVRPPSTSQSWLTGTSQPPAAVRTVSALADHLTFVSLKRFNKDIGNIHLGTVPPWLREDIASDIPSSTQPTIIGPTENDLKKHRENEKKRKLPATRVGAKFNHTESTGDAWLPSFGGVWNHQRRTHGQQRFMNKLARKSGSAAATATSLLPASHHIRSYQSTQTTTTNNQSLQPGLTSHEHSQLYTGSLAYDQIAHDQVSKGHEQNYAEFKTSTVTQNTFSIKDSIAAAVKGNTNIVAEGDSFTGHSGPYSGHSGPYSGPSGPYSGHSGPYNGQSGPDSGHSGPFSGQSGPYSGHSGPYSGQSGPYSGHSGPYSGHSGPYSGHSGSFSGHSGSFSQNNERITGMFPYPQNENPHHQWTHQTNPEYETKAVQNDSSLYSKPYSRAGENTGGSSSQSQPRNTAKPKRIKIAAAFLQ